MERAPRILLAGGGTGGHVYPAIAIADAIRTVRSDAVVEFAGTRDRMEWDAVPKAGYAIHPITVSGIQRTLTTRNLSFPFKLMKGMMQSLRLVRAFDADAVVGTGGYVSGPVALAAGLTRRPVILQEQNAYAGVTNRMLARFAKSIHIAFPEAMKWFPEEKCRLTGNPTRHELLEADRASGREHFGIDPEARVLFVFGGSLGSEAINNALEAHLDRLLSNQQMYVLWQTGARYFEAIEAKVPKHDRLNILKYVDRMDLAYAACDLTVCRAGALTCSELLVTETPSILVPSPNVAEDHQTQNARSLKRIGAAELLPETELMERLPGEVEALLLDVERLVEMSDSARHAAKPDAAMDIARDVLAHAGFGSTSREGTRGSKT